MFSGAGSAGRRYGVNIDSLPPIDSLRAESLKDFSKEDLRCYLESVGITPGYTKPEMKRQMRNLLVQINENKSNGDASPGSTPPQTYPPSTPTSYVPPVPAYIAPPTVVLPFNPPTPSPAVTPIPPERTLSSESLTEEEICVDCNKKANKECQYRRCRSCCLKKMQQQGYRCNPHIRDSDRRPTRFSEQIRTSTPAIQQRQPVLPPQMMHVPSAAPPMNPSVMMRGMPTLQQQRPVQPIQPQQPILLPEPLKEVSMNSLAECPRCHKVVSIMGASLWLHLKECDPDHLMYYLHLHAIGQLIPDATEKKKNDPLKVAQQRAAERLKRNLSYLRDIFSNVTVEELAFNIYETLAKGKEDIDTVAESYNKTLERMQTAFQRHDQFVEQLHSNSTKFYQHLQNLQNCATEEEIEFCKKEYENDFGVRIGPSPVLALISYDYMEEDNKTTEEDMSDLVATEDIPLTLHSL